jgi:kynurenine formamidase
MRRRTMRSNARVAGAAAAAAIAAAVVASAAIAVEPQQVIQQSVKRTPSPPWPAGDEMGMANQIGPATWSRCAWHMGQPRARAFELSYVRSNTMPKTPFSGPYVQKFKPTAGIPGTGHAFNGENYDAGAEPAQQATQIDAIGHFASFKQPWDGKPPFPASDAVYYGGYTQAQVKPSDDSPLLKLGIEKVPPLVTTAVVLDAKTFVGKGQPMKAGELVTASHIEGMLKAQGLAKRGVLAGDVVYIRTGWGDHWKDPDTEKFYYTMAPGLSYDAAIWLGQKRVVAIGLDTPFVDSVAEGFLQGKAGPAPGTPAGLPFAVHHHMLTQLGIHHLENTKLDEIANAKVWTACTMILPLRTQGSAGSPIRPVAIGVPSK